LDRRRQFEVASAGIDEAFQLIGGDPYLGISNVGLRVPTLATSDQQKRYLFNTASFNIADGAKARVRGYRQMWTLGASVAGDAGGKRFIEQEVLSPFFHLPDGNVSWHLRVIGDGEIPRPGTGPNDLRDFMFRMSDNPALLYETATVASPFYVNLTAYTPPNRGRPWGTIINSEQGTFLDQRAFWRDDHSWDSLDIPVDGPATIALFASVRQSNPQTRMAITPPAPFFPGGLSSEEQFLLNFPGAIIWRVAGALVVELDA
jgi:hypothetical protein